MDPRHEAKLKSGFSRYFYSRIRDPPATWRREHGSGICVDAIHRSKTGTIGDFLSKMVIRDDASVTMARSPVKAIQAKYVLNSSPNRMEVFAV